MEYHSHPQKNFKTCIFKHKLPFDFYIPELNLCIECNGAQHYISVEHFGGDECLKITQHRDSIKHKFCTDNNITLLYVVAEADKGHIDSLENYLKLALEYSNII